MLAVVHSSRASNLIFTPQLQIRKGTCPRLSRSHPVLAAHVGFLCHSFCVCTHNPPFRFRVRPLASLLPLDSSPCAPFQLRACSLERTAIPSLAAKPISVGDKKDPKGNGRVTGCGSGMSRKGVGFPLHCTSTVVSTLASSYSTEVDATRPMARPVLPGIATRRDGYMYAEPNQFPALTPAI